MIAFADVSVICAPRGGSDRRPRKRHGMDRRDADVAPRPRGGRQANSSVHMYGTLGFRQIRLREVVEQRQRDGLSEAYNLACELAGGHDRVRGIHLTWRCPGCRQWAMNDSHVVGYCKACGTPRPAEEVPQS